MFLAGSVGMLSTKKPQFFSCARNASDPQGRKEEEVGGPTQSSSIMMRSIAMMLSTAYAAPLVGPQTWDASFAPLVGNDNKFCTDYGFGRNTPYICAGGGTRSATHGGGCPQSGQYKFTAENGWTITADASLAVGQSPWRAFAYLPFCNGTKISDCWGSAPRSLGMRVKIDDFSDSWMAYTKIFFWTDGNDLVGLMPPGLNGYTQTTLVLLPKL